MTTKQKDLLDGLDVFSITEYLKNERETAFIIWVKDDVIGRAEEKGFIMDECDADCILSDMNHQADCEYGMTWDTIDSKVEDWISAHSFEVKISDGIKTYVTKFCDLKTNDDIDDYWNDDEYYFYGTSYEEIKKLEGKYFHHGACEIIKVE